LRSDDGGKDFGAVADHGREAPVARYFQTP
jgi:hypothetical protein